MCSYRDIAIRVRLGLVASLLVMGGGGLLGADGSHRETAPENEPTSVFLGGLGTGFLEIDANGSAKSLRFGEQVLELQGSFFGVYTSSESGGAVAKLLTGPPTQRLGRVDQVLYHSLYPRALHRFADEELPCRVQLEAFSPLVPGNLEESTLPVVLYSVEIENQEKEPLDVSFLFSQVCPFPALPAAGNPSAALPQMILEGTPRLGFQFTGRGPASAPELATLSVVTLGVEGTEVTGLPLLDGGDEDQRLLWQDFSEDGRVGNRAASDGRSPGVGASRAAALACRTTLEPGESTSLTFALSWHRRPDGVQDSGAGRFSDARTVAEHALSRLRELREDTLAWQERILKSSLPEWLRVRLIEDVHQLASTVFRRADGTLALSPSHGPNLEERWLWQPLLSTFFPELDRRHLARLASTQDATGSFQDSRPLHPGEATGGPRVDLPSLFAVSVYAHYLVTGDDSVLSDFLPAVTSGLHFVRSLDRNGDSLPDGRTAVNPEGQEGTYAHTGVLWLCALRCTERMAIVQGDAKLASECRSLFDEGRRNLIGTLWNGRYFETAFHPVEPSRDSSCGVDQLLGEALAQWIGLGPITSEEAMHAVVGTLENQRSAALAAKGVTDSSLGAVGNPEEREAVVFSSCAIRSGRPELGLRTMQQARSNSALHEGADEGAPSSWHLLGALGGTVFDAGASRLTIRPSLVHHESGTSRLPLFLPQFWAELSFFSGPSAGDRHLRVDVLRVDSERDVSLKEVRLGSPPRFGESSVSLRVFSSRGVESGQVTVTGSSVLFRFHEPIELTAGSFLHFHLAGRESGVVHFDLESGETRSRGALVQMEARSHDGGATLEVTNLGSLAQHISVRGDIEGWKDHTLYVDGKPLRDVDASSWQRGVDLWIEGPAISPESYRVLTEVSEKLVPGALGEGVLSETLEKDLDRFRSSVERFLSQERRSRSVRIDVLKGGREPAFGGDLPGIDPDQAKALTSKLTVDLEMIRSRAQEELLPGHGRNVVLSALYPLDLEVRCLDPNPADEEVLVEVELHNPLAFGLESEIRLAPPQGFQIEPISSDADSDSHRARFRLRGDPAELRSRQFVSAFAQVRCGSTEFGLTEESWFGSAAARQWQVIGPFSIGSSAGFGTSFPPESELDLAAVYAGKEGPVRWKAISAPGDWIDLAGVLGDRSGVVGYALGYVHCSLPKKVYAEVQCGTQTEVFVNGSLVEEESGEAQGAGRRVPLALRPGWNLLLLKVEGESGRFGFSLELTDEVGRSLPDIRVSSHLVPVAETPTGS